MARPRKLNPDWPKRLFFRHEAYYFVGKVEGKSRWINLGRDKDKAIAAVSEANKSGSLEAINDQSWVVSLVGLFGQAAECAYCGATSNLTVEHFIPVTAGGSDDPINLTLACLSCNTRKKDQNPIQFLVSFLRENEAARLRFIDHLLDNDRSSVVSP